MELRKITASSPDKLILEEINTEAIPECERNSLDDLLDTGAEVSGIYEDGEPVGFMVLRRYKSILYLAYLAVRNDMRSKGIGSKALKQLVEDNADCRTAVEYEAPCSSCESDMRSRRKGFYERCGFISTGWYTFYDETEFEIACAGLPFDIDEFNGFVAYLSSIVDDHIPQPYRK